MAFLWVWSASQPNHSVPDSLAGTMPDWHSAAQCVSERPHLTPKRTSLHTKHPNQPTDLRDFPLLTSINDGFGYTLIVATVFELVLDNWTNAKFEMPTAPPHSAAKLNKSSIRPFPDLRQNSVRAESEHGLPLVDRQIPRSAG